jgi:NADPH:quinone reductase-like Zn-dependent oxidoreductase
MSAQLECPQVAMVSMSVSDGSVSDASKLTALSRAVASEVSIWDGEMEVRYSAGKRLVKRYRASPAGLFVKELHMSERGSLDNLVLRDCKYEARELLSDDVEVKVRAVGLNFRDVLNVLGMYPGDPGAPGCEFAGVVTRVGSEVRRFNVGDEVMGMCEDGLREVVVQHQVLMHHKPSTVSMQEAATIPVVFCTVELALRDLAGLKRGDSILIHAAAGGVGLAAIQFAKRVGAHIFATASEGKHAYLKGLGVDFISTSRDASQFSRDMRDALGPSGSVDVVLNSLSDEYIPFSLDLLAPNGHFLEIGKRGVWSIDEVRSRYGHVH